MIRPICDIKDCDRFAVVRLTSRHFLLEGKLSGEDFSFDLCAKDAREIQLRLSDRGYGVHKILVEG